MPSFAPSTLRPLTRRTLTTLFALCAVLVVPAAARAATVDLGTAVSTSSTGYSARVAQDGTSTSELALVVTNAGPGAAAAGGTLTIMLDSHLAVAGIPATADGSTGCFGTGPTSSVSPFTCNLPALASGASLTILANVEAAAGTSASPSSPITAMVAPAGGDTDGVAGNDSASTSLAVGPFSATQLGLSPSTTAHLVGDSFQLVDFLSNSSSYASDAGTSVTIQADPGLSFLSGTVRPQQTVVQNAALASAVPSGASVACVVSADHVSVTCPVGAMAGKSQGSYQIQGYVTGVGSLHVTETLTDANTAVSTAQRTVVSTITAAAPVYGATDTVITGAQGTLTAAAGNDPGFLWSVTNAGTTDSSSGGVFTATIPAGSFHVRTAVWQDRNGVTHDCAVAGSVITCRLGILGPGAGSFVSVGGYATGVGPVAFSAGFAPTETDPNLANDLLGGTLSVIAGPPTNVSLALATATPSITLPGSAVFHAHVVNSGAVDAQDVVLTTALPGGASLVSSSGTALPCTVALGVVTCSIDPLPAGANADVTYTLALTVGGTIVDSATVSSGNTDTVPADNTSTVSVTGVYPAPKGTVKHSVAVKYAVAATAIIQAFTISQPGKAKVTATIPAASARILRIPAVVASGTGSAAKAGTGTYTLRFGSAAKKRLAKLKRFTITVTVTFTGSTSGKAVTFKQLVVISNAAAK